MLKQIFAMAICCSIAAVVLASPESIHLKPGRYAVSQQMKVNGQAEPESRPDSRCITASDLQNPEAVFNAASLGEFRADATCVVRSLKADGSKVSYDADCSNRIVHVDATLVSEGEFSAVRSVTAKSARGVSMVYKLGGKRTGDCTH
jgi:hypothetical protein